MESFNIIIKNEKVKSYRLIALIILLVNVSAFAYFIINNEKRTESLSALAIIAIYILIQWNYIRKKKQEHWFNEFLFFVLAFCWMGIGVYSLVAVCMVVGLLYFLALQKLEFLFNEVGVTKMNLPKKEYEWNEISNVILKDNMLTLDFKNNKIFQAEIDPSQNIDEQNFNLSCSRQVNFSSANK